MQAQSVQIPFDDMTLSGLWLAPEGATAQLVLAHGAGAGMHHVFMETITQALAEKGVATLRWQFPYMEKGSKRPDSPKVALAAWEAVAKFAEEHSELPLFVGGKSFGGRMASLAAAEGRFPERCKGLVYVGFPLHAAGKPGTQRAAHLPDIPQPQLYLQGTRDALADLRLLQPLLEPITTATLAVFEEADHSFATCKKSGITPEAVMVDVVETTVEWMGRK